MKEYITKIIQINPYTTLEQCLKCKLNRSARRNRVQKVAQKRQKTQKSKTLKIVKKWSKIYHPNNNKKKASDSMISR